MRDACAGILAGSSALTYTVEDIIAVDDRVVTRGTGVGTHDGELWGTSPTGNKINGHGITINRYEDGKIVAVVSRPARPRRAGTKRARKGVDIWSNMCSTRCMRTEAPRMVEIMEVEGRLASLAGVIAAATAEQVELIAGALQSEAWHGAGIVSPEQWVGLRCGVSPAHARRLVAAARGLAELPLVQAAFAVGELTEDHVAEIVRAGTTATHDDQVVDLAREATVTQLRKGLSFVPRAEPAARAPSAPDAPAPDAQSSACATAPKCERERRAPVRVSFGYDDDGTWWLNGRLRAEDGALIERALVAGRDAVFRDRHAEQGDGAVSTDVSWADALVRVAHAALDGLDPSTAAGRPPSHRYQVIVHLHPDAGVTRVHEGPVLSPDDAAHVACDATARGWWQQPAGPVNLGRRARVVDDKLRTVIEHRDQGCVVPGCGQRRWLRIHHVWHWEHGGPTDSSNLVSLCAAHHRAVHDGEIVLSGDPDRYELVVTDASGRVIGPSPPRPIDRPLDTQHQRYRARSGERADWRWMWWRDLPDHAA